MAPQSADGKFIVLGVSGGIAAYKAVEVCRRLTDLGAHVAVVTTQAALRFVGEATWRALSSEHVHHSLWDDPHPIPHTRLGQHADAVVVCPATARVIAAYANGLSDDLLSAVLLATRAPVVVCPAMHTEMWEHPALQANLSVLADRGVRIVPPGVGQLAGQDSGVGRLAEPDEIVRATVELLSTGNSLQGKKVLVTAGGTREPIDAVRFIGNRSSGKQGYALAEEARARGAEVTLVATARRQLSHSIELRLTETAQQMEAEVLDRAADSDIILMAAAVADFRPSRALVQKHKKQDGIPQIELEPTPDILQALGRARRPGQLLVGFAAESGQLLPAAEGKLADKNLDMIVANDITQPDAGFDADTNQVLILTRLGEQQKVPIASKREIASVIFNSLEKLADTGTGDPH